MYHHASIESARDADTTVSAVPEDPYDASRHLDTQQVDLLSSGNAASERQDYEAALDLYLRLIYFEVLGRYRAIYDIEHGYPHFVFDQYFAIPTPLVLHRIAKCVNTLGVEPFALQMRFFDVTASDAQALAHLNPPITPEQAWGRFEDLLSAWIQTGARWSAPS